MKQLVLLYFFCCFIVPQFCFSQTLNDSLQYYYNVVKNSKNHELLKAYDFYNAYVNEAKVEGNVKNMLKGYANLAIVQYRIGSLNDSENSAVEALRLLDTVDSTDVTYKIILYNHLGKVYKALKAYESSLKYYKKALELEEYPINRNIIRNNIGSLYMAQKKYEEASKIFSIAYEESKALDNPQNEARILGNWGLVLSKMNDTTGLQKLKESLEIRRNLNYTLGLFTAYDHLVDHYNYWGNRNMATTYLDSTLSIAEKSKNPTYLKEALSWYAKLNPDKYVRQYQYLLDSLESSKQVAKNQYAAKKYAYERQERIAKEKELYAEKQKRLKSLYQAFGGIIVIVSFAGIWIYREKHKKDTLKSIYETETNIAKRVHDEVANDIYRLMINVQKEPTVDILQSLETMYHRTRDISKDLGIIETNKHFASNLYGLMQGFQTNQVNILVQGFNDIEWNKIENHKKVALYRVIQELLVNMKKHSQANVVVIRFTQKRSQLKVNYSDNGIGSKGIVGNGLLNTENRIKNCNGSFIFETKPNAGFKAEIVI